jgi:type II secretory pathway component PulC
MRTTLLLALAITGCAATQKTQAPPPAATATGDAPPADNAAPAATSAAATTSAPAAASGAHEIARGDLVKVLDASPGYFLQHVVTEPQLANGRFVGWRLVSFFPGDARFAGVDLQAGDVVTRINGKPIEAPDQFMAVWDALRKDGELVVDMQRNGAPRTLRWTIADK